MTERRGDWMQTYSGRKFWPLDPRPEDVHAEAAFLQAFVTYVEH